MKWSDADARPGPPASVICEPGSGWWTPARILTKVDFPEPFWPTTATISSESTRVQTRLSAFKPGKLIDTLVTSSNRSDMSAHSRANWRGTMPEPPWKGSGS